MSISHEDVSSSVLSGKGLPRGPCRPIKLQRLLESSCISDYDTRQHEAGSSLDGMRDVVEHTARRRLWSRGMNSTAMKYYEVLIRQTVTDLIIGFEQHGKEAIDISRWMTYFG